MVGIFFKKLKMKLKDRIDSFVKLGKFLSQLDQDTTDFLLHKLEVLKIKIKEAEISNNWFTNESVLNSLRALSCQMLEENFDAWITPYNLSETDNKKRVLIVMAGNIPLVGFHDFMSVIISGNKAVVKLSSNDKVLFPFMWEVICEISPELSERLEFIDDVKERKFDAVIATGSDNSAKYFEYYFRNIPRIIRKNRRSIAILNGKESKQDLEGLSKDIFLYFGLGCRNVSKLFLPRGYGLNQLFDVFFSFQQIVNHKKYANNYDYNKAVFLMGGHKLIENGFLLMKEDSSLQSPVSMLYYEFYDDIKKVNDYIDENSDLLQCVVSKENLIKKCTHFGETQKPNLWDYSDNIDTIEFLSSI